MLKSSLVLLLLALSVLVLGGTSTAFVLPATTGTCPGLLDNNTYICDVKCDNVEPFSDTLSFTSSSTGSVFQVHSTHFGQTFRCNCDATISDGGRLVYNERSFLCVNPAAPYGLALDGTVKRSGKFGANVFDGVNSCQYRCRRSSD